MLLALRPAAHWVRITLGRRTIAAQCRDPPVANRLHEQSPHEKNKRSLASKRFRVSLVRRASSPLRGSAAPLQRCAQCAASDPKMIVRRSQCATQSAARGAAILEYSLPPGLHCPCRPLLPLQGLSAPTAPPRIGNTGAYHRSGYACQPWARLLVVRSPGAGRARGLPHPQMRMTQDECHRVRPVQRGMARGREACACADGMASQCCRTGGRSLGGGPTSRSSSRTPWRSSTRPQSGS